MLAHNLQNLPIGICIDSVRRLSWIITTLVTLMQCFFLLFPKSSKLSELFPSYFTRINRNIRACAHAYRHPWINRGHRALDFHELMYKFNSRNLLLFHLLQREKFCWCQAFTEMLANKLKFWTRMDSLNFAHPSKITH